MKKYAAALSCVLLFCGCSNTVPKESDHNEKVAASQEKLENMTALYTGLAEANETIDNKSDIGVWAYEDGKRIYHGRLDSQRTCHIRSWKGFRSYC